MYDVVRQARRPEDVILAFAQSTYESGREARGLGSREAGAALREAGGVARPRRNREECKMQDMQ